MSVMHKLMQGVQGVWGATSTLCAGGRHLQCVCVGRFKLFRTKEAEDACDAQARLDRISDPSSSYWGEELGPRECTCGGTGKCEVEVIVL